MTTENNTRVTANDAKYVPKSSRSGIALCLCGGGYRAALYQSGAVRPLNELGILGQLQAVSSVSGGSIFAAFLANRLIKMNAGRFADYEADIAAPFRQFTKKNIRTTPALRRLLPWEWLNGGAQSQGLESQYETHLCTGKKL